MSRDGVVTAGPLGRVELTGRALRSLVRQAAESVPGVTVRRPRRGVDVVVDGAAAAVALEVSGRVGLVLPELGEAAQRAVAEAVARTAGLSARVDVLVEGLEP